MMIEKLKVAYIQYWWAKVAALLGLAIGAVVLYDLSGGMPPWAWRFLLQVLPQLSHLWAVQGSALLLPLLGLLLLSAALLVLWGIIVFLTCRTVIDWWQDRHAQQRFEMDLQEAELLAEERFAAELAYEDTLTQPIAHYTQQTERMPRVAPPSRQQAYPQNQVARAMGERGRHPLPASFGTSDAAPAARQQSARRVSIPPSASQSGGSKQVPDSHPSSPRSVPTRKQLHLVPSPDEDELDSNEDYGRINRNRAEWGNDSKPQRRPAWDDDQVEIAIDQLNTIPVRAVEFEEEADDIDALETLPGQRDFDDPFTPAEEPFVDEAPLRLVVSIALDPGIVRKNDPNEDSVFAIQGLRITDAGPLPAGLFVVADGMGGHANGREASRLAIQSISDIVVPGLLRDVSGSTAVDEESFFLEMLKDGAHRANLAVYKRNRELQNMMGTTLTSALIVADTAFILNVGDSRTYLYRAAEGLKQITRDHSYVATLVENGQITHDEIYTHPRRNQIYRCLGEHATVEMDTFTEPVQADDILILCSDGLWEMVRDNTIEKIVASSAHNIAQISAQLVQAALSRGGADNISVVVVGVVGGED